MQLFEVTLTQKYKVSKNAETPSDALKEALLDIEKDQVPFSPNSHTVKEVEE